MRQVQNRLGIAEFAFASETSWISLTFRGTSRKYLIGYLVLDNSLRFQETDDLHNFQFHRLEYHHIHRHCRSHLGWFHIYFELCSNSKNCHILKSYRGSLYKANFGTWKNCVTLNLALVGGTVLKNQLTQTFPTCMYIVHKPNPCKCGSGIAILFCQWVTPSTYLIISHKVH